MLLAINPELEQSARASGASWLQCMRFVLLPLLLPAIIAAWLMLFVIFIRELGATILLYAQGHRDDQRGARAPERAQLRQHGGARGHSDYSPARAFLLFRLTRVSLVQS